jgi:DMSO reductase family type II enzyme chaperone
MPTPSEPQRKSEFGAGHSPPRRSIFGNYKADEAAVPLTSEGERSAEHCSARSDAPRSVDSEISGQPLQSSIDTAFARTFIYRLLAKAYEDPELEGWQWLASPPTKSALWSAVQPLAPTAPAAFACAGAELANRLAPEGFDDFHYAYVTCFGHTVRGDCPMNEIEYGDIKADPLFQPHRLADLGAFYAAFGLEMTPDAAQRQDHISIELEFLSVLAAKEAYALEHQLDDETALCREAQKKFLREHLGRWTPAFTRRLARMADGTALGALADFTREFIIEDCARFKVTPGSEDLLLRPIDESSESLCASCGITNLPPGATSSPVEE